MLVEVANVLPTTTTTLTPICKFTQRFRLPENNMAGRWREGLEGTPSSWEVSVPKARTILWQIEGSPSGHAS